MQPQVIADPMDGLTWLRVGGLQVPLTPDEATRLANDLTDAVDILDGRTSE